MPDLPRAALSIQHKNRYQTDALATVRHRAHALLSELACFLLQRIDGNGFAVALCFPFRAASDIFHYFFRIDRAVAMVV